MPFITVEVDRVWIAFLLTSTSCSWVSICGGVRARNYKEGGTIKHLEGLGY